MKLGFFGLIIFTLISVASATVPDPVYVSPNYMTNFSTDNLSLSAGSAPDWKTEQLTLPNSYRPHIYPSTIKEKVIKRLEEKISFSDCMNIKANERHLRDYYWNFRERDEFEIETKFYNQSFTSIHLEPRNSILCARKPDPPSIGGYPPSKSAYIAAEPFNYIKYKLIGLIIGVISFINHL